MASFGSFDTTEEETNSIDTEYKVPTVATTETDALEQIQTEEFYKLIPPPSGAKPIARLSLACSVTSVSSPASASIISMTLPNARPL